MNYLNLDLLTDSDLRSLQEDIAEEIHSRKEAKKAKLIEDFKSAFNALREAGVSIRFSDYQQESYRIVLDKFDHFEFN